MSKGAIDRMLDLARERLLVEDKNLDADPWLLNTKTCTIDLRSGRFQPHDARDLITRIAPLDARRGSKCPRFEKFLERITGGDAELASYIQKAVGYTLTGIPSEQAQVGATRAGPSSGFQPRPFLLLLADPRGLKGVTTARRS